MKKPQQLLHHTFAYIDRWDRLIVYYLTGFFSSATVIKSHRKSVISVHACKTDRTVSDCAFFESRNSFPSQNKNLLFFSRSRLDLYKIETFIR